jgi:hypothetical protein
MNDISGMVLDSKGDLTIVDSLNNAIRKFIPGAGISAIARGGPGLVNGPLSSA